MAVSSSNTTKATGSSLDVAGIVTGLMEAENVPVTKLEAKISSADYKISALGKIKSQLSSLKTALTDLQTPSNFYSVKAKLGSESVATAQVASTATEGSYKLVVTQLATTNIKTLSGFSTAAAATTWFDAQVNLSSNATATVLFDSTNNKYVLALTAKTTGSTDLSVPVNGAYVAETVQTGTDALFKLNGVDFVRSSNTVTDALTGVTLNLLSTSAGTTLTVAKTDSTYRTKLEALVKSYNDLYAIYKEQTASSTDPSLRGVLNSDFSVTSMMRQVTTNLMLPLKDALGQTLSGATDLSSLGLKLLDTGKLIIDESLLSTASATLQTRLNSGIRIGFDTASSTDLTTQIGNMLDSGGVIQDRFEREQKTQSALVTKKTALQEKLVAVQARYYSLYAALDALLYKLNSTSDSLKSALDGLTSSQNNG